jgi:hypothetical protein
VAVGQGCRSGLLFVDHRSGLSVGWGHWLGSLVGLLVVADGRSCQSGSGALVDIGWPIVWCYWSVMLVRLLVRLLVWEGRSGGVGQGRWLSRWSGCWFCCWLGRWSLVGPLVGPLVVLLVGPLVGPLLGGRLLLPLVRAVGQGH